MQKLIQGSLAALARRVIRRYRPRVIAITGSIGKTSTKEAVLAVLGDTFRCRGTAKNYNNELGVPLTIFGTPSGGRNPFRWLAVYGRALWLLVWRDRQYPDVLILEMGADHPGDLQHLVTIAQPDIAVVTGVAPVHTEFFGDLKGVAAEKSTLVRAVPPIGTVVLAADDQLVAAMASLTKARALTYGFSESATIRASEERVSGQQLPSDGVESIRGMSFKVSYAGNTVPILLPTVVGRHSINAALAAIGVGIACDLNIIAIAERLRAYQPPKGRMNLIDGIKYTLIIDDTYNSSPIPALAALDVLASVKLPGARHTFAVLGDMLELGSYTERAHLEVGRRVAELGIDFLVAVGAKSQLTANAARGTGMAEDRVIACETAEQAGHYLQDHIEQGDLILVKGSQGMRMEKVVKEIMADPLRAPDLLVRQDGKWVE